MSNNFRILNKLLNGVLKMIKTFFKNMMRMNNFYSIRLNPKINLRFILQNKWIK